MKTIRKVGVRLDTISYRKIKEYSILNETSQSEIISVLISHSPLHVNARQSGQVILEAKEKGKTNTKMAVIFLDIDGVTKLKKMCLKNNASYSEIVRSLISEADLKRFKFKTKGQKILEGKNKAK